MQNTGKFYLSDSECNWLKLQSLNDGYEAYIDNNGDMEIKNITITSWNISSDNFAPESDFTRAYVYTNSNLNIYNSNLSYLGYNGLLKWGVVFFKVSDFIVTNSTFYNNYEGIYTIYSNNSIISYNSVDQSYSRGIDARLIDNVTINNNFIP